MVRPRQVRAVELRADRERERDEADRAEVADDPHRVLGEQPRREVVRPRPSTVGPITHAREQLPDHRRLPEPPADDAAEVRDRRDDRDRDERAEQPSRHEEHDAA